jgi:Zn-dependent protease with chaperone function
MRRNAVRTFVLLSRHRGAFAQLFATHPPTAERVARLHADTARLQHAYRD